MAKLLGSGKNQEALEICISDTIDLVERLSEYYETPEEVAKWFRSPQPLLNNETPEALIAQGRAIDLHRVWDSLDSGAFI